MWFLLILTVLAKFGQNPVDSVNFNRFSVPQKMMILAPAAQDFSLKIISNPKIFFSTSPPYLVWSSAKNLDLAVDPFPSWWKKTIFFRKSCISSFSNKKKYVFFDFYYFLQKCEVKHDGSKKKKENHATPLGMLFLSKTVKINRINNSATKTCWNC